MPTLNIFTIEAEQPFADVLCRGIRERFGSDPLTLSNITLLLPNRRSCRAVREAFLRQSGGVPMLLPTMQPLGDVGDDDTPLTLHTQGEALDLPPVLSTMQTRIILTTLIEKWQASNTKGEKITTSQAAHLAIELAALLTEVEREQLSFEQLSSIVPDEFAQHWQITLDFLRILMEHWPDILAEKGAVDSARHRNLALGLQQKYWQDHPPAHPVIAAGSTGSIPAVAQLLKTIATLPNGMVVLPGLDTGLDTESWEILSEAHPQFGLKTLLEAMEVVPEKVKPWQYDAANDHNSVRLQLIREVMRPAETSHRWQHLKSENFGAIEGITRLDLSTMQEEAAVIALMLRQMLETPDKTAALVTQDRLLARRVASMMQRWEVTVDDSAGMELGNTTAAVFLRLVADMALACAAPVALLACLKHPLATGGMEAGQFRHHVRTLETKILRGVRPPAGLKALYGKCPQPLIATLEAMEPFIAALQQKQLSFKELITLHIQCAEFLAATSGQSGAERLWARDEGEQLKQWLDELLASIPEFKPIDPADYIGLFEAMLVGQSWRPRYGAHPRLSILSPMEARMQHFDLVILGGLNEGVWPMANKADPWMSRPMRKEFGLPLFERKTGLSAHDFAQLFCATQVVMTRPEKAAGSQTIPSRWLLRLDAVLKILRRQEVIKPDKPWRLWAAALVAPSEVVPYAAPRPTPPVSARPRTLSVTRIERLMRDPYSIYASKILHLKALDPIDQDPGAAQFGNFVHKALDVFVQRYDEVQDGSYHAFLLSCAKVVLAKERLGVAVETLWWPKFERIASWFVENEAKRRSRGVKIYSEIKGKHTMQGFTITAKADRVEIDADGHIAIIDYKTGTAPTDTDVVLGFSPQMTLEALIAEEGGFEQLHGKAEELAYWRLNAKESDDKRTKPVKASTEVLIEEARQGVQELIALFDREQTPYLYAPVPQKSPTYNDFEHLARKKEWEGA